MKGMNLPSQVSAYSLLCSTPETEYGVSSLGHLDQAGDQSRSEVWVISRSSLPSALMMYNRP